MNVKSIFKMEMYKFYKEPTYLIAVLIIATVNTIGIVLVSLPEASASLFALAFFSIMATMVINAMYPIQSFSEDYKNNVIASVISSGVKRSNYYFVKIGVIIINSILISTLTIIVPLFILYLFSADSDDNTLKTIVSMFEDPLSLINQFVIIINHLIILTYCTILLKGNYLAILLYFTIVTVYIIFFFNTIAGLEKLLGSAENLIPLIFGIICSIIFILLSRNLINKQDL